MGKKTKNSIILSVFIYLGSMNRPHNIIRGSKVQSPKMLFGFSIEMKTIVELEGVHKACPSFSCQEYRDYFDKLAN